MHSLTRISRDFGQSAAQLGKECDAGCVDGTEGLQSQWLKNVGAYYYYYYYYYLVMATT